MNSNQPSSGNASKNPVGPGLLILDVAVECGAVTPTLVQERGICNKGTASRVLAEMVALGWLADHAELKGTRTLGTRAGQVATAQLRHLAMEYSQHGTRAARDAHLFRNVAVMLQDAADQMAVFAAPPSSKESGARREEHPQIAQMTQTKDKLPTDLCESAKSVDPGPDASRATLHERGDIHET